MLIPATGGGGCVSGTVSIHLFGDRIMRPHSIAGLILIVLGVLALAVRSVTYFTTEHVTGPLGFFSWEVDRPHTIFISPIAGIIALVVGLALIFMARRRTSM
jgi:hypothetical protein